MAVDVVFRANATLPIERGGTVVAVDQYGNYQRIDRDDIYPLPAGSGEDVLYNRLNGRMDNKGYY